MTTFTMSGIRTFAIVAAAAALAPGCDDKKPRQAGLPPATNWKAGEATDPATDPLAHEVLSGAADQLPPAAPGGGSPEGEMPDDDIHAGLGSGGGGVPTGEMPADDIHAGLGAAGTGSHPPEDHGGRDSGGGVDVAQLGLPPPDPDAPIDPAKVIQGTLRPVDATRDRIPKGGTIFLSVRAVDASGQPTGMPLAVHRLALDRWPLFFQLDGGKAMIGGTSFEGEVAVMARYDQDEDALSKQPGDVTGVVKTRIPAKELDLRLDTVLP